MGKNRKKRNSENKPSRLVQLTERASRLQKKKSEKHARKNKQRVESIPKKLSASQLAEWKERLDSVAYEANTRIQMIQSAGYTSYAIDRVIHEGDGRDYFDLEDINTREDLIAENTRMRVFLNDKGSTIEGARLETAEIYAEKYRGKFGNQYKEKFGVSFDTSALDPEIAKKSFENYRKVESSYAGIIGKEGEPGVYGSENLIMAMYDAEFRGLDSYNYGVDLLDAYAKEAEPHIKQQQQTADEATAISGLIEHEMRGGRLF